MIWHIFNKDVRLLWWLAAGAAALEFIKAGILASIDLFPRSASLSLLVQLLSFAGFLAVGFTIVAVVHQDAIPGVRQDWLVRPIRRGDLLAAKLVFVVLLVQSPVLMANFCEGLAAGFSWEASFEAALSRSLFLFLLVDVPLLAFASITRNLMEAIAGSVVIFAVVATLVALFSVGGSRWLRQPVLGTSIEWIAATELVLVLVASSVLLLSLQFFRRRTLLARWVTGAATVCGFAVTLTPWQPAFAIERSLVSVPGSARSIAIEFDPRLGRSGRENPVPFFFGPQDSVRLSVPLRISGLPAASGLQADQAEIRIVEPGGLVDRIASYQQRISALDDGSGRGRPKVFQPIFVPGDVYRRVKDRSARLEIDYSLTLFLPTAVHALPAINGDQRIPNVGHCGTRVNAAETAVQFRCAQAGWKPGCLLAVLEHHPGGERNPAPFNCEYADYAPYLNWELLPDSMWRFGANLPFRDNAGLARYPVNGSNLRNSQVEVHVYEPADHFTRKVAIPEIRLGEWQPAPEL